MATRGPTSGKDKNEKVEKADKVDKGEKPEKCGKCNTVVKEKDDGVQCEICEIWYHAKCEGISDEGYKILLKENVHWYCIGCNRGVGKVLTCLIKVQQQQEVQERKQIAMELELRKLREDLEKKILDKVKDTEISLESKMSMLENGLKETKEQLSTQIESKIENTIKKSYAEMTKEGIGGDAQQDVISVIQEFRQQLDTEKQSARSFLEETQTSLQEERDKEARRQNIIIYRVQENTSTNPEERMKADRKFVMELCKDVLKMGNIEDGIKKVFRLGKRTPSNAESRPMLVEFRSIIIKNQVMESLGLLKEADDRYRNVTLSHDMTKNEREQCKETVKAAKEKAKPRSVGGMEISGKGDSRQDEGGESKEAVLEVNKKKTKKWKHEDNIYKCRLFNK